MKKKKKILAQKLLKNKKNFNLYYSTRIIDVKKKKMKIFNYS